MKPKLPIYALTLLVLLSLLGTCRMDTGFGAAPPGELPADKVLDVARSYSGPFTYETLLPVALKLTVELYEKPDPMAALEREAVGDRLIVVTLRNAKGEPLYTGSIPPGGTLQTVLSLPAAPQDAVLRLESPGFEPREVTIEDLVRYSEVTRVMGLLSEGLSAKEVLPDADGDGVPDVYDAEPHNPSITFVNFIPGKEEYLSVAFEDLYLQADAGDADYNDFLAMYKVAEYTAGINTLSRMDIEAVAVAKLAGYNHDFGMVIDFGGVADAHIEYFDAGGSLLNTRELQDLQGKAILPLFEGTKDCIGRTTKAVLTFKEPVLRSTISLPPYDPYLYVWNTKYDIHLIGRESLPKGVYAVQNNPPDAVFQDLKGYPWSLLVPTTWKHPAETQYIGMAYPLFDRWRESFGQEVPSWYLYPAGSSTEPGNRPPYPVIGEPEVTVYIGTAAVYLLGIATQDGLQDPDGDPVTFMSSQLPSCIMLDGPSGAVKLNGKTTPAVHVVYFWSMDSHGASTIDNPCKVTFTFKSNTTGDYPRIVIETFSPNGDFTADTYLELFGASGNPNEVDPWTPTGAALAYDDNSSTAFAMMSKIDYAKPLSRGTYYIRVRGSSKSYGIDDWYAIRVLSLPLGGSLPSYPTLALAGKPDAVDNSDTVDDYLDASGVPSNPVPIDLTTPLSRTLFRDGSVTSDVDWFKLVLP